MIMLLIISLIIPLIWGVVICRSRFFDTEGPCDEPLGVSRSRISLFSLSFLYGFLAELSVFIIWYIIYLLLSLSGAAGSDGAYRMSVLGGGYRIILAVITIVLVMVFLKRGGIKPLGDLLTKRSDDSKKSISVYMIITVAMCIFQVLRVVIAQPAEYRDDRSYIALIGDILYTDRIYGSQIDTGRLIDGPWEMQTKWLLSPWYHFIAFITGMSGLHPTIVYKTIMPVFVMLLFYISLYELGRALGLRDKGLWIYMLISVVSYEALSGFYDPATGFLVWPMWGKNPAALVVIPLIYVVYTRLMRRYVPDSKVTEKVSGEENVVDLNGRSIASDLVMFLVFGIAGCGMTATCMMVIPIELAVLGIIYAVSVIRNDNKKRSWTPICISFIGIIPAVIEFVLYTGLSQGWML